MHTLKSMLAITILVLGPFSFYLFFPNIGKAILFFVLLMCFIKNSLSLFMNTLPFSYQMTLSSVGAAILTYAFFYLPLTPSDVFWMGFLIFIVQIAFSMAIKDFHSLRNVSSVYREKFILYLLFSIPLSLFFLILGCYFFVFPFDTYRISKYVAGATRVDIFHYWTTGCLFFCVFFLLSIKSLEKIILYKKCKSIN